MDVKKFLKSLGFSPKNGTSEVYTKKYSLHNYSLNVDIRNQTIDYGSKIKADSKTTQNFSQDENFVVLECVDRLLEKGYKPKNIILEKTWPAGHGTSGRLDICVTRDNGTEYMLIECKTSGKEFDKEFSNMQKNGGQLFTYFKFTNKPDILVLYASELVSGKFRYISKMVKIEDEYRSGDVKDFYEKWSSIANKAFKDNGVFEDWVAPYNFKSKALTIKDLKEIEPEDSSNIFNTFLEILRHNVVSDKPNAFNKIFTLFLCKIYDEKMHEGGNEELKFQWIEGEDNHEKFQLRLTDLYKEGMKDFLDKEVTDFSENDFRNKYASLGDDNVKELLDEFKKIRLEKNNEFAIKEVFDKKSFEENAVVVRQVVKLLQGYKIRYSSRQQYLSDFFEMLLTTGLKQESGQFFTPVPIAQFIIKSLPIDKIVNEKLKIGKKDDLLPYIIDYAAGSGHFITESMHVIQKLLDEKTTSSGYIPDTFRKIKAWQEDRFYWASQYEYGIEKDYRLVKVAKVGCYLHGDGLANVVHSDGLAKFGYSDYKGKLKTKGNGVSEKENREFDIVISNPPYSVEAFKNASKKYYDENDFELYKCLTDQSSEIECLFLERTKQLLKDGGLAGVILPSSILSNGGIYSKTREIILKYFEIIAITELGSNTFMATGTNTVVLFLRRRNNYESSNIATEVDRFFSSFRDVTINGIENPVKQYVAHVWGDLKLADYIKMLKGDICESVKSNDIYKDYAKTLKYQTADELQKQIIEIEKEKILYYILASDKKVVIIKTGEKDAEKRFLGYEFSNRRGNEGIHPIQRGKTIDECTKLFDSDSFTNPEKASSYIYSAFNGKELSIDKSLQDNVFYMNLADMITFDRPSFDKVISTSVKKKIKYENIWGISNLVPIVDIAEVKKGTSITKEKTSKGSIPVVAGGKDIAYFHNKSNRSGNIVTISASGAYSGFVNYFPNPIFASDCTTISSRNENSISTKLIYHFLKSKQKEIYSLQRGQAQPHVYSDDIEKIKIPLPPKDVQDKIVSEIEKVENKIQKCYSDINENIKRIDSLFLESQKGEIKSYRLSDKEAFSLNIGRRVLTSDLLPDGKIPVYSANVFESFGNIDKLLIKDFNLPSVLWGIDGDWMVNFIEKDIPFYPTDHCGVLRVLSNDISPRYVAWVLQNEGKHKGFSRQLRASIDRIEGLTLNLPSYKKQQLVASEVSNIESNIEKQKQSIQVYDNEKNTILKKYL